MRHLAIALGLALTAGCTVDLEGAACRTTGSTDDCPEGQACGTGLTCSRRAASCTPCVADRTACLGSDPGSVYTCSAEGDPACGTLSAPSGCGDGKVCAPTATGATCTCSAAIVDPDGAEAGTPCRYASIHGALAQAVADGKPEVLLGGAAGQAYGDDAADRAGIAVPDGMILRGDDASPAPAGRVVLVAGGGEGIRLGAGSVLRGVKVHRAPSGPAVGVRVTGASPAGGASLDGVVVDAGGAGGAFATGVLVEGSGTVRIAGATVAGTTTCGLEVARADGDQAVEVTDGLLQGNAVGLRLLSGALAVTGARIFGSGGPGVQAVPAAGEVAKLALRSTTVARGGNVGLHLQGLAGLELTQVQVCLNAGRSQTIAGVTRTAGGLLALGNVATAPVLQANRFHGNTGDQVVIGGSASAWSLASADCQATGAAAPNLVAGYTAPGVGVAAISSAVDVTRISWGSASFPALGSDFLQAATGTVTGSDNYCEPVTTAPDCPAAP